MPEQTDNDRYRAYSFSLEAGEGVRIAYFTNISRVGAKVETIEYREGGDQSSVRKLPGRLSVSDVKLSYGVSSNPQMWGFFMEAVQGLVVPREMSIIVNGPDLVTEQGRWNLGKAWICEVNVKDFDARSNDILIETMTLTAETLAFAP